VEGLSARTKKSRATRFGRVALFSIESLSFRFPIDLFKSGLVLPAPPLVNRVVKLYFLVPLTITARFYPRCIFECPAKLFSSAAVQLRPGFTRAAPNSAAKLSPFHVIGSWLGFALAIPSV
jgi:hypothetical protein